MLNLIRTHDFQVQLSPSPSYPAAVNPPSFNWPENRVDQQQYTLELKSLSNDEIWHWENVNSPMQLSFELKQGQYQWRLLTTSGTQPEQISAWIDFQITEEQPNYIAPTAAELFKLCDGREQWLMYFDEDIESIKDLSIDTYTKLKQTAKLSVPMSEISYPNHYQRGQEEGKREAIANVRKWIDRDLMVHTLLYKIWGEEEHGQEAMARLLQLAEWSPEGPASLLRPCTWGDEVGCSLARNLFLAYHWLSPLLEESEKAFVRPMLIRIAKQLRERLAQDKFEQYPGHSHTSRLPSYLGLAALALHREHDRDECEQWLDYSLMIYRGILPFYGGADGSWVEGAFYASTYSKWYHAFFLSVERLSGFSFYQHPFYQNFHHFAHDFITPDQDVHPFGDGFWCRREGKEWPGFFSQNPLRVYAARFGDEADYQQSIKLESAIKDYRLHLLDVVPTIKQLAFNQAAEYKTSNTNQPDSGEQQLTQKPLNRYYSHAGFGKLTQQQMAVYYRCSAFGNSSHRHGDQGNIALFDNDIGVLIPTGSYGYRFGSKHHSQWTRKTMGHNLPLVGGQGQRLDDPTTIGQVVQSRTESNYHSVTFDLTNAYTETVEHFYRTVILIEAYGLIVIDSLSLAKEEHLNWRLHSPLSATLNSDDNSVLLNDSGAGKSAVPYQCHVLSHANVQPTLTHGYTDELSIPDRAIESDASKDVVHLDWQLPKGREHQVVACCIRESMPLPEVCYSGKDSNDKAVIELKVGEQTIDNISHYSIEQHNSK